MTISMIWAALVVAVTILAIACSLLKHLEELEKAVEEAGEDYLVCDKEDDRIVASFSTDWEAESFIDDDHCEAYYVSYPEERIRAILAKKGIKC